MKSQDGYTLIELLVVTAIISVLAATAIPQFYPFKTRAYDTDAKANLRNVFQSCKGYWALVNGLNPCVLSTVSNNEYGFVQSSTVEITIASNSNNTESDFVASANHLWSSNTYMIDYRGVITSISGGGSGAGQSAGNGAGTSVGGGSSKEEKAAAKAKKKKEKQEKAAAKKKAKEEAKAKKKKEKQEKAAAKKKAKEEAKAKKKKEKQEKAAAKKKAKEEAKAKKKAKK